MRLPVIALVVLLATSGAASAQRFGIERTILIAPPVPSPSSGTLVVRPSPAATEDRLWSFDADGDDRVSIDELPERMQPLMTRGDANMDGYLDIREIPALVDRKPPTFTVSRSAAVNVPPAGLPGVVSDLRLPPDKHERALAIVRSVSAVRNINDPNSLNAQQMQARMRELLNEEEYENFAAAAARPHTAPEGVVVVSGVSGGIPGR